MREASSGRLGATLRFDWLADVTCPQSSQRDNDSDSDGGSGGVATRSVRRHPRNPSGGDGRGARRAAGGRGRGTAPEGTPGSTDDESDEEATPRGGKTRHDEGSGEREEEQEEQEEQDEQEEDDVPLKQLRSAGNRSKVRGHEATANVRRRRLSVSSDDAFSLFRWAEPPLTTMQSRNSRPYPSHNPNIQACF